MAKLQVASFPSPFGRLHVISDQELLIAAGFGSLASLQSRLSVERRESGFQRVVRFPGAQFAWESYLDGDFSALTQVTTEQSGGEFRQRAWKAMSKIPAGKTITYADLAQRAGSPAAVRAAGTACAANLIAPFIPCHRIIRTGGGLGGYGYGVPTKIKILRFEGAL